MGFIRKITGLDIYSRKQSWKLYLLLFAAVIVLASLYYTDIMVRKIAREERQRVELWVEAIQKRELLLQENEKLFADIQHEEQKRVDLIRQVYRRLNDDDVDRRDLNIYIDIITSNSTIPLVMTDADGEVITTSNLDERFAHYTALEGSLADYFSTYPPLDFPIYGGEQRYIYYQDSRVFAELRDVMNDLLDSFISELVINSANVPVIVVDSSGTDLIAHGNITGVDFENEEQVNALIRSMADKSRYLSVTLPTYGQCYVYYTSSFLLTQLRYYPLAQFLAIGILLFVAYVLFSVVRRAEQNQVWVGMSKETAHQLGTPLSSLIAWLEMLRMKGVEEDTLKEIDKDVKRLENITERFSKIGSPPKLIPGNIVDSVHEVVDYMKNRTSRKVSIKVAAPPGGISVPHNRNLLGWVVENIIKNAIDAMKGRGRIYISLEENDEAVIIDVSDDGKGIPASQQKAIFNPGYTSKKAGWGLGLSLSKRIIENYHGGKLFVKHSAINQGTTFRIILYKPTKNRS
ncbi:MAG: HAMP domain-containing sensor histidine kinase [Bacteroidales bacterium]|nr:HAMP domain-containing sensor histidine kinase [Bacteroidales bacterium]